MTGNTMSLKLLALKRVNQSLHLFNTLIKYYLYKLRANEIMDTINNI